MWRMATEQDSTDPKHKSEAQTLPKSGKRGGVNRRLTVQGEETKVYKENATKKS